MSKLFFGEGKDLPCIGKSYLGYYVRVGNRYVRKDGSLETTMGTNENNCGYCKTLYEIADIVEKYENDTKTILLSLNERNLLLARMNDKSKNELEKQLIEKLKG